MDSNRWHNRVGSCRVCPTWRQTDGKPKESAFRVSPIWESGINLENPHRFIHIYIYIDLLKIHIYTHWSINTLYIYWSIKNTYIYIYIDLLIRVYIYIDLLKIHIYIYIDLLIHKYIYIYWSIKNTYIYKYIDLLIRVYIYISRYIICTVPFQETHLRRSLPSARKRYLGCGVCRMGRWSHNQCRSMCINMYIYNIYQNI